MQSPDENPDHEASPEAAAADATAEQSSADDVAQSDRSHWAKVAARAADDKLGTETMVVDVGDVLAITEMFVISTGNNPRQVKAIAEAVEEQVDAQGGPKPVRIEGLDSLEWVLLDYGDFVVHAMHADAREYYQLERLWKDQPQVEWRLADDPRLTGS